MCRTGWAAGSSTSPWGTVDDAGVFTMFRRAKLMLDAIPADALAAARDGLLVGRLGLTDPLGDPVCAPGRTPADRLHRRTRRLTTPFRAGQEPGGAARTRPVW
ncbi:hypothetical protein SALBM311S_09507 [Streptomyces alboniger]